MNMPRHMMTLSKQEKNIVKYHKDTMKSGKVGRDSEGRPETVYSTGIMIPEGPNKAINARCRDRRITWLDGMT